MFLYQYHIAFWALVPPSCDQLGTIDNILETTGVYISTSIWTPEYSQSCQLDHCRDIWAVMLWQYWLKPRSLKFCYICIRACLLLGVCEFYSQQGFHSALSSRTPRKGLYFPNVFWISHCQYWHFGCLPTRKLPHGYLRTISKVPSESLT